MKKFVLFFFVFGICIQFIAAQNIDLIFPNGGEHFINNTWSPHNITWESSGVSSFKLEYSENGGSDWILIEDNYATQDHYSWDIPDIESTDCLIRVTDAGGSVFDESEAVFTISSQNLYVAEWNTTMGQFRAELRGDLVPITAQNFINLSEKGFYTDLIFHRVIPQFMIQDGCPFGTGYGDPGYEFDDEFHPELRHSHPGILSMANAGPNTNGSQYFITVVPTAWLDDAHAVFGRIIDGMDVVYEISEVETDGNDKPLVDIVLTIDIVESVPELSLVYPSDGLKIEQGRGIDIIWESDFIPDSKIEFSSDNGSNWITITDSIPSGDEIFPWTVPDISSTECLIKITSLSDPGDFTQNSIPFEIREKPADLYRFELYEGVSAPTENPENIIMPDFDLNFKINMQNLTNVDLNLVTANLVSHNDDLVIVSGDLTFDNIPIGEDLWSDQAVEIQLPAGFPVSGQYSFSVYGTASNIQDIFWLGDINIPVLKKNPFMNIDDDDVPDSYGNNNNTLEPGETIELEVKIDNASDEILYNVYGQLTIESDHISIWNNIVGVDGIVYDTAAYNNGDPINPHSSSQSPIHDFVFDYNADEIYQTDFLLKIFGYLYEEAGSAWDEGGILMKWGIPVGLNSTYPPVSTDELEQSANLFNILQNPASEYIKIEFDRSFDGTNDAKIEISNINGKIVYSENLNSDKNNFTVSTSGFTNGLYFIRISNTVKKVIILK